MPVSLSSLKKFKIAKYIFLTFPAYFVNPNNFFQTVKNILSHKYLKTGISTDESNKFNDDGKFENEPNNVEEGKEAHTESESESDSKFGNPRIVLTLERVNYQGYDSAGKFINS